MAGNNWWVRNLARTNLTASGASQTSSTKRHTKNAILRRGARWEESERRRGRLACRPRRQAGQEATESQGGMRRRAWSFFLLFQVESNAVSLKVDPAGFDLRMKRLLLGVVVLLGLCPILTTSITKRSPVSTVLEPVAESGEAEKISPLDDRSELRPAWARAWRSRCACDAQ